MPSKTATPARKKSHAALVKLKRVVVPDDVLTPEEAKLVRRGEAQLRRGDSKSWRDVKKRLFGVRPVANAFGASNAKRRD